MTDTLHQTSTTAPLKVSDLVVETPVRVVVPARKISARKRGLDLAIAQFGQPTTLGFAVFTTGLAFAAAVPGATTTSPLPQRITPKPASTAVRGRSSYAERLHGGEEKDDSR